MYSTIKEQQQEESNPILYSPLNISTDGSTNSTAKLLEEAEFLRQRALQLKAEAKALEASLNNNRYTQKKNQVATLDSMIDAMELAAVSSMIPTTATNHNTTFATVLADVIQTERWSPELLLKLMDRLHERQNVARNARSPIVGKSAAATFQIGDVRNAAANETEWMRLDYFITTLIEAAAMVDDQVASATTPGQEQPSSSASSSSSSLASSMESRIRWSKTGRVATSLKSRINELRRVDEQTFQRKLAMDINTAVANTNLSVEDYVRKTLGLPFSNESDTTADATLKTKRNFNLTRVLEKVAMVPRWVPSSLLPFMLAAKTKIDVADIRALKEKVLTGSKFYCTSTESIPTAALFRGNVRPSPTRSRFVNATELRLFITLAFEEIQQRLQAQPDLASRLQLFLLQDPEWRPVPGQDERDQVPDPVILALPITVVPDEGLLRQKPLSKWGKV